MTKDKKERKASTRGKKGDQRGRGKGGRSEYLQQRTRGEWQGRGRERSWWKGKKEKTKRKMKKENKSWSPLSLSLSPSLLHLGRASPPPSLPLFPSSLSPSLFPSSPLHSTAAHGGSLGPQLIKSFGQLLLLLPPFLPPFLLGSFLPSSSPPQAQFPLLIVTKLKKEEAMNRWIAYEDLDFGQELGRGNYGAVKKGTPHLSPVSYPATSPPGFRDHVGFYDVGLLPLLIWVRFSNGKRKKKKKKKKKKPLMAGQSHREKKKKRNEATSRILKPHLCGKVNVRRNDRDPRIPKSRIEMRSTEPGKPLNYLILCLRD